MADSQQVPPSLGRQPLHSPVELKGRTGPKKPPSKAKSFTRFLCKSLFFALFLVAIPLFPSQAPGFVTQTVLTKFWELVHLLFIGVAVSYGLFCRRNVDMDIETHTTADDNSESYVSRVFHVSSIFEEGYGEKNTYQNLYSENYKTSESLVDSEKKKIGSFNCESGFGNSWGNVEHNVSQAWNSQYFHGESLVVVAQPDCSLSEYGDSEMMMGYRSLNLPVRSLRSVDGDQDSPDISDRSESSSPSKHSSNSTSHLGVNENIKFGDDLGPTNLENRFDEADTSSPDPWRPRSERIEFVENVGATAASRSRFRPLSVDETQFESLKSKSLWSSESFSSQAGSVSDSPNRLSPSLFPSHGVELENLRVEELERAKMEELGRGKSFRRSYPPDSRPQNNKTSLNAFHIRRYSTNGSLFEKNPRKSFEDGSRDTSRRKREEEPLSSDVGRSASSKLDVDHWNLVKASSRDTSKSKREEEPLSSDAGRSASSKLDGNPGTTVKALSRGKSVRTIRSRRYALEAMKNEERSGNRFGNKLDQKQSEEVEAVYKRKHEVKNGSSSSSLSVSSTDAKMHDLDNHCSAVDMPNPKTTSSEIHKRKSRECLENLAIECTEEPANEAGNLKVRSTADKESVTTTGSVSDDAGSNANEVDKKAGEFIAKFREQIRLQKMASIDRSRGRSLIR